MQTNALFEVEDDILIVASICANWNNGNSVAESARTTGAKEGETMRLVFQAKVSIFN